MDGLGLLDGVSGGDEPFRLGEEHVDIAVSDGDVELRLVAHLGDELAALVGMVDGFDGLLEADGDEETEDDGGDVDEEVAPGVDGFVGRVDVEHKCGLRCW
jgi:hypothetical protein